MHKSPKSISCLCFATLVFSLTASAIPTAALQDTKAAVEEPQYINQFQEIGPDGKLIPLESQTLARETKTKNHFVSNSVSSSMTAPNASSPVRVPPTARFVIKAPPGSDSIDPSTLITMRKFTVADGKRTLPQSEAKAVMFGGVKSSTATPDLIALNFKKYGTSSYEVVPAQPLPPGEYIIGGQSLAAGAFCFGVDAK